jgi:hypothetical protein
VPGNVQADLMRAGCLPDLHYGMQAEHARWVDQASWWLVRDFPRAVSPGKRAHLVLRGVDYLATCSSTATLWATMRACSRPRSTKSPT